MATFSPRELAGVLVALGQLGYKPGPEWFAQVRERAWWAQELPHKVLDNVIAWRCGTAWCYACIE